MAATEVPSLRWGIVGCGLISSWFVSDLLLSRTDAPTKHILQCVGSSSIEKGTAFLQKHAPTVAQTTKVYASYAEVYNDPDVDIVYIGTPHALHLTNGLAAIAAGKNVLCEKPMTINAKEADVLVKAAREKGVYLMEAVWTRFFPIVASLQDLIHKQQIIGRISRGFIDIGLDMPLASLPSDSRTTDPALGAGALLDIGIYTLTWASLIFGASPTVLSSANPTPRITSSMSLVGGVDEMSTVILNYEAAAMQAICTCSMRAKSSPRFARIEGEKGTVWVCGVSAAKPGYLIVELKGEEKKTIDFPVEGWGFHFEADAVAADLRAGRRESAVCGLDVTRGMMDLMDNVRKQNGLRYTQDSN
ncbi:hypothetical protein BGZ61DRAFT_532674 [Ilyonectria robusta]|uniref:uncharacterized protein n=1 Tax=Ilyonectria robusta TaxID=1079257 RepID=UPI001E8DAF2F|nr:uncharacterized protein BGZ61DRAFT_532674 [Ilyonectria robusta]KAH8694615.1 hypothetical protein BGZ61DRAFT_532674 [Ilyonectria robusta]